MLTIFLLWRKPVHEVCRPPCASPAPARGRGRTAMQYLTRNLLYKLHIGNTHYRKRGMP
jgi:hypothetical protein